MHPDDFAKYLELKSATASTNNNRTWENINHLTDASQLQGASYVTTQNSSIIYRNTDMLFRANGLSPWQGKMVNLSSTAGGDSESDIANRNKAVQYALEHGDDTSDHDGFHYFVQGTGGGSDCANFVSQCLFNGGKIMSKEWYWNGFSRDGWMLGKTTVDASAAWLRPDELYRYFSKPENSYGVSYITSVDEIPKIAERVRPGDVIAFNNLGEGVPKGYINHVAIVTGVNNGEIYYSGLK